MQTEESDFYFKRLQEEMPDIFSGPSEVHGHLCRVPLVWRGRGNGSKKQAEKSCLFLRRGDGAARGVPFRLSRAEGRKYRVNKQERLV